MNFVADPILAKWINPRYLNPRTVEDIRQSVLAKPDMMYTVLDDFFNVEPFEELVQAHFTLEFSEEQDRRARDGAWLPYDGAVQFARPNSVGGDLFYRQAWHRWCAYVLSASLDDNARTDVKLRYHRHYADGFWIHTDGGIRQIVAISYFNLDWKAADGGLLQLWRIDPNPAPDVLGVESPKGRMDFLANYRRIRTATPGGGWVDGYAGHRDLVLADQIVPTYNRIFLCNFQTNPCYHSVTPSNGKIRYGFVQWIGV